jgi:hypothetical protein
MSSSWHKNVDYVNDNDNYVNVNDNDDWWIILICY